MPDVDVLTRLSDLSLAGTARDREVWGDPTDPVQYAWLRALAPYDTVAMQPHPALMVTAGWYDGVVGVGGPAKWVQRVRALRSNDRQTLLSVDFEVGHAGTGGRLRAIAEQARIAAWVLEQVGLAEGP
jgi:oligopeptidase B